MAFTSAAAVSDPAREPRADARIGFTTLGLALSARWLIALLLLSGGVMVSAHEPLSSHDWLLLVQGRAFLEVVLAAMTTAGAFAATRAANGSTTRGGAGLRLLALADLGLVFSWALEGPLLPPFASARLVAITALVHASFAYVALRHLGAVCARAGEHGASAWADADRSGHRASAARAASSASRQVRGARHATCKHG